MRVATIFTAIFSITALLEGSSQKDDLIADASCPRCVEAREYNRTHPNPYFYYEEYVEAQKDDHHEKSPETTKTKSEIK